MGEDSEEGLLMRMTVPVYDKDLHQEHYSFNVKLNTDNLEHGDKLQVTVEKSNEE